jgi:hypothetical protein
MQPQNTKNKNPIKKQLAKNPKNINQTQTTKKNTLRTINTLVLLTSLGCSQVVFAEITEADKKSGFS